MHTYNLSDLLDMWDNRPFCDDPACDCHTDVKSMVHEIGIPLHEGLLTEEEARRLYWGRQILLGRVSRRASSKGGERGNQGQEQPSNHYEYGGSFG
jgi:hypothetical protein